MNFPKNLWKCLNTFCGINTRFKHKSFYNQMCDGFGPGQRIKPSKIQTFQHKNLHCSNNPYFSEIEEITSTYPYIESQTIMQSDVALHILFKDSTDKYSQGIVKCVSVEEVFTFVRNNIQDLDYKHLAQVVLVIKELQSIYACHYQPGDNQDSFLNKLLEHQEFYLVTKSIENKVEQFDPVCLSFTLWHLYKLGIAVENQLIQNMAEKLRDHLLNDFKLDVASRLISVIFAERSIRPYYIVIKLIPRIFREIESLQTSKDLDNLSLCLYRMNDILTSKIISNYATTVNRFIDENRLTKADYKVVIKVASIFNLPKWRPKSSTIISKCILLIKDSIEELDLIEMCHLYDIFFKNQEPGEVLNNIQRAASKLLNEIEDNEASQLNRLKLFSSVIYYTSPINKKQFRNDIFKYVSENETIQSLIILRKIFSYLKISDPKLCEMYWNKACQVMKKEDDIDSSLKLLENYLYFCGDVRGFKHHAFEHHALTLIQKHFKFGLLTMYPNRFFSALSFALVCCHNMNLMDSLLEKFKELSTQLTATDIFRLSNSLQLLQQRKLPLTSGRINEISNVLRVRTVELYSRPDMDEFMPVLLVKSAVTRRDFNNQLTEEMLIRMKEIEQVSSKLIEYACYNLQCTKSLIPEVINLLTGYITANRGNIVGFNAEKMLFLLYELNYQPVYEDEFFKTVIDVIIRDQERMSGLGFLQAAMSLCFFNQMPKSFVKQIFNVEFLDKLDVELANCYFKDKYPHRVRDILMQLNRAMCLEYPEYDVPWFHQKYIEEYQKNYPIDDVVNSFHRSVKGYLQSVLGEKTILENIVTPYGYEVDFVFHLDRNLKPTEHFDDPFTTKFALLLKYDYDFTRLYVRLKGKQALMNRHLEILGYKVKMIRANEWSNLLYAEERAEFINNVVFS